MKSLKFIRGAIVALAALGVVFPQVPAMAAQRSAGKSAIKTVAASTVLDISLAQGGTLKGRVVDHTGAAMEGAEVVLKQGKTEVARTITDKDGTFVASNLKGGVYTVASGATEATYRAWSEQTAPPSAKGQPLLVLGQNGARGQGGLFDGNTGTILVLLSVAILGVVIADFIDGHQHHRPHTP